MGQLGDAIVQFPVSGSQAGSLAGTPPSVYLRNVQQCLSATMYFRAHPGGTMTGSFVLAPANPNRAKLTILNSGSLNLAVEHGTQAFNANAAMTPTNNYDNLILGTNANTNPNVYTGFTFQETLPVYTGPVLGAWVGNGSASGSICVVVDYSA
ncbi:MAG TPA: hypothetical protein VFT74_01900 [Isosphaeraceae bacterium]|nr:hypothetical protein [Isosphaeraceae bacterium]